MFGPRPLMDKQPIQPGNTYSVEMENSRFRVRAVRPAALRGWWLCEGEDSGEPLMVPEDKLMPAPDD